MYNSGGSDMKVTKDVSVILDKLLDEYEKEVLAAKGQGYLRENTSRTYLLHSRNFVKWCNDDFEPGGKNK